MIKVKSGKLQVPKSTKVKNEKVKRCHITASFNNEILTVVLESIIYAKKGLQFEYIEDNKIMIKGKCTD